MYLSLRKFKDKRNNMLKIDVHNHVIPKVLPRWAEKFGYGDFIHLEHHKLGYAKMMRGDKFFREIKSNTWDAEERIEEYARFNTQIQVICTIPVLFSYWAKPMDGLDISRFLNDDIAVIVDKYPNNYIGLGTVPLQDVDLAIQEMIRCKEELGFPGLQIGSNIEDMNLSDPALRPFFEACEKHDMSIFVHPWNMMGFHKMRKYWLPWLVGMPAETTRAITSLLFSGIFEELPDLRFCFAHAGGSFVSTIGRIEHGFNCRPDLVAIDNDINPREYIGKFWVDSITHDIRFLKYIMDTIGSEKICFGTDYPFPLGDLEIGKFIEESDIPEGDKMNIMHQSTLDWLNLDKKRFIQ